MKCGPGCGSKLVPGNRREVDASAHGRLSVARDP
jgi:hypothetical protein